MSSAESLRVLMVGDLVGRPGRAAFGALIPRLRRERALDLIIANCENAAAGFGVTPEICQGLFAAGADVLTSGNHIWKHKQIYDYIASEPRLLRPANYPDSAPGSGECQVSVRGENVTVINLMGRIFMAPLECPFSSFDRRRQLRGANAGMIIVDFHAEATAEKLAFARYVDGRASLIVGTHTHVQTADAQVLPGGAGYQTDLGMTGPHGGVIGVQSEDVIGKLRSNMPVRFRVADGPVLLQGAIAALDPASGRCRSLESISLTWQE